MSTRTLRRHAFSIFRAALAAADPAAAVRRCLARRNFARYRNIYVIGAG
jgi:glycerate-2-kinase